MANIPVVMAIIQGASSLGSLYSAQANAMSYEYTKQRFAENDRFWSDYRKNTGVTPRYPYRAGAVNNYGQLYAYQGGVAKNVSSGAKSISKFYR